MSALDFRMMDAAQVDRRTGSSTQAFDWPIVAMQAPYTHRASCGKPLQLLTHVHASGGNRARDDGSVPRDGERPVDGHSKQTSIVPVRCPIAKPLKGLLQLLDTLPGSGRSTHDLGLLQERARYQFPDVVFDQIEPGRIGEVAFGQNHHSTRQAKQAEDLEVFASLRHDGVVSGDDQHRQVQARGACQHVSNETLMTWHIDQGQPVRPELERKRTPGQW